MTTTEYAARAADKYLDAYARQGGRAWAVGCGMTYAANQLRKAMYALQLELPGDYVTWWGERYRLLALQLTTR